MATFELAAKAILLGPGDDVAVAKESLAAGTKLNFKGTCIELSTDVPQGHKIALRTVAVDAPVRKYGQIIGFATREIAPGDHVHVHNLGIKDFARDYAFATEVVEPDYVSEEERRTFEGYLREDSRVGTRNYVVLLSTVHCSATATRRIADCFRDVRQDYPHVDGVVALTHQGGCGANIGGTGTVWLQRVLAGYAKHPNVAGYVLVALGCEVNQAVHLIENHGLLQIGTTRRPPVVSIQAEGGLAKAVEAGVREVAKLLPAANAGRRTTQPAAKLVLGTECGGSDANSGITANPAVGWAADEIVRQGGTAILSETPEMYGAEHLLTRRARSVAVGEKLIERIRWWENYVAFFHSAINNNPAPGNIEGGLTNIYEKSLGAIAKGGTTPLNAVYEYAERITETGFVIMDTPGYDPPSVTGLVAGGANLIAFTTGRGSVLGGVPVPSLKVASNSALYHHMPDDMDINAGVILEGQTVAGVGRQIFEELLAVASGQPTKSEAQRVGEEEFNPWLLGPTL
jgi:altronate hydrolase